MKHYVLGFAFDSRNRVVLIHKERPDWQRGKWNGVGGHINEGELPYSAMVREFKEETGVLISNGWRYVGQLYSTPGHWACEVYTYRGHEVDLCHTASDEPVDAFHLHQIYTHRVPMIENIPLLVALCCTPRDHTGHFPTMRLSY